MPSFVTSAVGALCAIVMVGCAPDFPPVVGDCRVGELVDHGRVPAPFRHEIVFVIDTHGDVPSRAEVAAAAGTVVRVLGTGDLDGDGRLEFDVIEDDLRIAVITSAPECGEAPELIEWVPQLGIGGDIDGIAERVEIAVRELPTCSASMPLAAAERYLESQLAEAHARLIDVVIVTDEDEMEVDTASFLEAALRDGRRTASVSIVSPLSTELVSENPDWDAVLASPSCVADTEPTTGLLSAARALEAGGVTISVGSLCGEVWVAPLEAMVPRFAAGCRDCWCIPRVEVPPEGALAPCELIERLGSSGYRARCAELPGREPTPLAIDESGIETCRIIQRRALETEPGWRLDTAPELCGPEGNHVALVGTELEPGSSFELRCVSIPASEGCE